ncbi:hypothetical protein JM664_09560 [Rhodobacteraceae bacterium MCCB 386]|nr:hypothetical protein [Roseitranquillus sediminis]MBM9594746.1 hypothetical protein [Roseitranquillus sediminis]
MYRDATPTSRRGRRGRRQVWRPQAAGLAQDTPRIDEETLEFRSLGITGRHIGDARALPDLLSHVRADEEIGSVTANGACDTREWHDAIAARSACAAIPPRRTAGPWKMSLLVQLQG